MRRLLFLSLFLLTACSTAQLSIKPLILKEQNNNETVNLAVGQQFTVQLKENPTTGYQWAIDTDIDNLTLEKEEYVLDKMPDFNGQHLVGCGGIKRLVFSVKKAGTTTLKLKYWRAWEKDSSIVKRFSVTLQAE